MSEDIASFILCGGLSIAINIQEVDLFVKRKIAGTKRFSLTATKYCDKEYPKY